MNKQSRRASVIRDIAILLLLIWVLCIVLILMYAPAGNRLEYFVAILMMEAVLMVGFLGNGTIAVALGGTQTSIWVAYKLYFSVILGHTIVLTDFAMIPMPLLAAGCAFLFNRGLRRIDAENRMLHREVDEMVLVDHVTGMYNARAMLRDMQVMVRYSVRHSLDMSLMIVQMRYGQELKNMLSNHEYQELLKALSVLLQDVVRVEDRVYAVDDQGTLAVLLTCEEARCSFVRTRILAAVDETDAFEGVLSHGTKLALRIGYKGYDEKYGNDMLRFKQAAENELAYDV